MLAGGAIVRWMFGCRWDETDFDIFFDRRKPKRIKVEYKANVLDLVFKNVTISDFDISICQIGIDMDTDVVYATPLFLYSTLNPVLVCRISNWTVGYRQDFSQPIRDMFHMHLLCCKESFQKCNCGQEEGLATEFTDKWFRRISKYEKRLPWYQIKFVDCEYIFCFFFN